ncbi:MAG: protein kinase [Planctomycetota bacterium]
MSENLKPEAEELFQTALSLPAEKRDAWLARHCPDDPQALRALRWRIDQLGSDRERETHASDPVEMSLEDTGEHSSEGLSVHCPHCRSLIQVLDDQPLDAMVCGTCSKKFSLLPIHETEQDSSLPFGKLHHFKLLRKLGSGAFGTVYQAFDESLARSVAIKIPRKEQVSTKAAAMFLREARTAAQLRHPNIVSVHEVGREDDRIYIVSDLVDGVTLTDWLSKRPPTSQHAARLMIQISLAIHYAHQQGVIHRDLKPGNIMLDRDDTPYVMDFGLAKLDATEMTMTMDGQILGTPAYMAPEQARGESRHVDCRADIYALGVILFEMLTGDRPFRGNTQMLLLQLLNDEPPNPRRLNPGIHRDIETICLKCLEKPREKRYETAAALADDLQRYLDHRPIAARRIGALGRGLRWCKRKPVVASLSLGFLLALIAGTATSSFFAIRASANAADLSLALSDADVQRNIALSEAAEASKQKQLALRRANEIDQANKELRLREYANSIQLADSQFDGKQIDRAASTLQGASTEHRGWEWDYLANRAVPAALEFPNTGFAMSGDGKLLALQADDGSEIRLLDFKTLKVLKTFPTPETGGPLGGFCGFSHDDRWLLTGGWGAPVRSWNVESGKLQHTLDSTKVSGVKLSVTSPLAISAIGSEFRIYDLITGKLVDRRKIPGYIWSARLLPQDRYVAFGGKILDLETGDLTGFPQAAGNFQGEPIPSLDGGLFGMTDQQNSKLVVFDEETRTVSYTLRHDPYPTSALISPRYGLTITGSRDGSIRVWSQTSKEMVREFIGHASQVGSMALSNDGRWLVTTGRDSVTRVWRASDWAKPKYPRRSIWTVECAPSGDLFAILSDHSDGVSVRRVGTPEEILFHFPAPGNVYAANFRRHLLCWDSQGKRLAVSFRSDRALVLDIADGETICELQSEAGNAESVLFAVGDSQVILGGRKSVEFFNSSSGEKIDEMVGFKGAVSAMCLLPGQSAFAASGLSESHVSILDTSQRRRLHQIPIGGRGVADLDCDGTGQRLAVACQTPPQVVVVDIPSREVVCRIDLGPDTTYHRRVQSVAISPDGTRLAVATLEQTVSLFDADSGELLLSLESNVNEMRDIDWSADGRSIVTVADGEDYVGIFEGGVAGQTIDEIRKQKVVDWPLLGSTRTLVETD